MKKSLVTLVNASMLKFSFKSLNIIRLFSCLHKSQQTTKKMFYSVLILIFLVHTVVLLSAFFKKWLHDKIILIYDSMSRPGLPHACSHSREKEKPTKLSWSNCTHCNSSNWCSEKSGV